MGLPFRATTNFPGSSFDTTAIPYVPLTALSALVTASVKFSAPFALASWINCASTSVSVSLRNTYPLASSFARNPA